MISLEDLRPSQVAKLRNLCTSISIDDAEFEQGILGFIEAPSIPSGCDLLLDVAPNDLLETYVAASHEEQGDHRSQWKALVKIAEEVGSRLSELREKGPEPIEPQQPTNDRTEEPVKPRFDPKTGELWFEGRIAITLQKKNSHQWNVLKRFQDLGWPECIDSPAKSWIDVSQISKELRKKLKKTETESLSFNARGTPAPGYRWTVEK